MGAAILGTLLVTVVLAVSRLQAQAARADRRLAACRVADALLEGWWSDTGKFPRRGSGQVTGHTGWSWRTSVAENPEARALGGEVVALEVFAPGGPPEAPAVRVEVVFPEKTDAAAGTNESGPDAR